VTDLRFVDTTLRDGPQSLWSMEMRTNMMLPVAGILDRAGFDAIEIMASPDFKKCVRDLKEDPWERLRLMHDRAPRTPLRFIRGRYYNAFQIESQALLELWTGRLAANGIRQMRISDSSNTASGWETQLRSIHRHGMAVIVNLIYTLSPKHTDEYYAQKTREAAALQPDALCIKDPGALITPDRVRTLVPLVLANANGIPVEFHTHCLTGLGAFCTFEAIRLGVTCVNTAIPPLAEGASNPSTFNVAENARLIGMKPVIDLDSLRSVETHFSTIAEAEGRPMGRLAPYDHSQYLSQVPGGMISNFRSHLTKIGKADAVGAVLAETACVRADFGYPIMVTPYSQFIGTQAALNVISGERYKTVSEEIIHYALGWWGEEERASIDPNVLDRILATPRARELEKTAPPDHSLAELRRRFGGAGVSDDDLLLRIVTDADSVAAMRAAPPGRSYDDPFGNTLVDLIGRLDAATRSRSVGLKTAGISLNLWRH
jgi:oxaloacetate decarboxylase alpha subunit